MADLRPHTKIRPSATAAALKPEALIELLPDAAYVCDVAGRITAFNRHAARLWGSTPKLNDDAHRYCGAFRLMRADGTLLARDDFWTVKAIRENALFHDCEAILERSGGERRSVLVHASPLHDEQGVVVGGLTVVTDVTERNNTEAALRESEDRFRRLSDASFEALMVHERGIVLDANRAFLELFGFKRPEDLIGKSGLDVLPFAPESKAHIRERLSTPRDDATEVRVIGVDGVEQFYETQSRAIRWEGRDARVVAMRDVTRRRRSEKELRDSQTHLMASQRIARVGSWELDITDGKADDVNPLRWTDEAYRIFGYSPGETEASNEAFWARVHPDDRAKIELAVRHAVQTRSVYEIEHRIVLPDGQIRFVHERGELEVDPSSGAPLKIVGTSRDVTEMRSNEEALRESEARHRLLTEHAHVVLWEGNPSSFQFTFVSEFAERLLGYPRNDWYQTDFWTSHIHPDDRDAALKLCMEYTAARKDHRFEYRMIRRDGRVIWVEDVVNLIVNGDDIAIRGVLIDITERKEAENRLRAAEARHRAILNALPDLMFRLDGDGRILDYHAANSAELYRDPEAFMGRKVEESLPGEVAELIRRHIHQALETRESQLFEYDLPDADGVASSFEARMVVSGENETTTIVRNVTERKRLEEQLRQSQKLEAVGRLAGGIAHDFNNLLTVVNGYSQMLLGRENIDDMREPLTAVRDAGRRAAMLVKQLLAFSRGQRLQPVVLDLNGVLVALEDLIRRMLDNQIDLELQLVESPELILADRSQMEQVVVNLAVNARDSMPRGGRITLQTQNVEVTHSQAAAYGELPPGSYVRLCVIDEGEGMAPEVLAHVFEPFFTTKDIGKGTGLGLAVVHGIVKQSGGHIEVASEVGKGTKVTIFIPAAKS